MHKFNKYIGACLLAVVAGSAINAKGGCNKPDGSPYYETSLAIAAHGCANGEDDGGMDACASRPVTLNLIEQWVVAENGDDIIERLKTACSASGTITKLNMHSHGTPSGMFFDSDLNCGLYKEFYDWASPDAATIADLQQEIIGNRIRFCNVVIKVHACNLGNSNWGQLLSSVTQGTVYVANGRCEAIYVNGKPSGEFYSDGSPWKKYVNGVQIPTPHENDPDLTTPNQYGTNRCKFW